VEGRPSRGKKWARGKMMLPTSASNGGGGDLGCDGDEGDTG
jgi:hypothetical protein